PLLDAGERARDRYESALSTGAEVRRATARIKAMQGQVAIAEPTRAPEQVIAETAATAGVLLVRVEPDPEGGLRVALDAASATNLFPWLALLQREHGLSARNLTVVKGEGGGLRVDATLDRPRA
ncbi:MAG: type II secretion system protein GspM, partial [Phenylobacterium sp.]|nr:type II secretion system protein GspM [Phenylobacterium sp.]